MNRRGNYRPPARTGLIALVALCAQLLVAGSGVWHHHGRDEGGGAPHSECGVCAAAALDGSDAMPPADGVAVVAAIVTLVEPLPESAPPVARGRECLARGPPATA